MNEGTVSAKVNINEPITKRAILEKALKIVEGDRPQNYGKAENNFMAISNLWSNYLGSRLGIADLHITDVDVSVMMILLKVARIASGHAKEDNWVDIAGYSACGGEIEGAIK